MKVTMPIFKQRIETVLKMVESERLEALVVFSSGSSIGFASTTHGYLRYLCDWDPLNRFAALILIPGREPTLLVPARSPQLFAKEILWFNDIRAVPVLEFGNEIASILKPILRSKDKVGYIGQDETPFKVYDTIIHGLIGIDLVDARHLIDPLRMIKDKGAIDLHRRAAKICDDMFEAFEHILKTEKAKAGYKIQADIEHVARYAGCEYASTFFSIGPVVDRPRYYLKECNRNPAPGDQYLLSLFIMYQGHWGHAIRTGTVGPPSLEQRSVFDVVAQMHEAALAQVAPGNKVSDIWKASERVACRHYPNYIGKDWYRLKAGHGLGLDYSDPVLSNIFPNPYSKQKDLSKSGNPASAEDEILVQTGMLFELHPNLFVPEKAAAALGDMVLVNEKGHEILNRFSSKMMIV